MVATWRLLGAGLAAFALCSCAVSRRPANTGPSIPARAAVDEPSPPPREAPVQDYSEFSAPLTTMRFAITERGDVGGGRGDRHQAGAIAVLYCIRNRESDLPNATHEWVRRRDIS